MCGFLGAVFAGNQRGYVEKNIRRLTHRGPDEQKFFHDAQVSLGFCRLSILDLERGSQPMGDGNGLWIVFNGEIYNSPLLKKELQQCGHSFTTHSDTEVILHAFDEWGREGIKRLNGMFAFALWDDRNNQLITARDPFGIKPFFYSCFDQQLIFSSEPAPLLEHPQVKRKIDRLALLQYLHYRFVPSPRTLFEDLRQLEPGEIRVWEAGKTVGREFISPLKNKKPGISNDESEIISVVEEKLSEAVGRHLLSDVPVGLLLSGGLDSNLLLSFMKEKYDQQINTFSVGFGREFGRDELEWARKSADYFGTNHHEVLMDEADFERGLLEAVEELQFPLATTSVVPMRKLCQLAGEHLKVVLSGQGADEPFAGYRRYIGLRWALALPGGRIMGGIPEWLGRKLKNDTLLRQGQIWKNNSQPVKMFSSLYSVFDEKELQQLWPAVDIKESLLTPVEEKFPRLDETGGSLTRALLFDAQFQLSDDLLGYSDRISMRSSLELRVPYLDHELAGTIFSLPDCWKVSRTGKRKVLLKKIAERRLPDFILNRDKRGFETPYRKFLKGKLGDRFNAMIKRPVSIFNQLDFNRQYLQSLACHQGQGSRRVDRQVFTLLMLGLWYEQWGKG